MSPEHPRCLLAVLGILTLAVVIKGNGAARYNEDKKAGTPDLRVAAVVHDAAARSLQLNVCWSPPADGALPDEYFLRVKSINESCDYCGVMDFVEDISNNVTCYAVPPVVTEVDADPRVLHECTYSVRLESWPSGGQQAAEMIYTVPERVGDVWSCRQSWLLPMPRDLHVSLVDHTAIDVSWRPPEGLEDDLRGFALKLGREIESPLRDWFEYGPEVLVEAAGGWNSSELVRRHLEADLSAPLDYLLEARVLDARGCRGPAAEARFSVPDTDRSTATELLLMVLIPLVLVALAAVVCVALLCRKKPWLPWQRGGDATQPASPFSGEYNVITVNSRNGPSSFRDPNSSLDDVFQ